MATKTNSAFKVKASTVQSHAGIKPEKGAILFHEGDNVLIYGDGFNWLNLGGAVAKSALATSLLTPVTVPRVAGVPGISVLYDTVIYNLESGFTPALGNQVTFNKDMTFDFSADFEVSADVPQVTFILRTYLDAVLVSTREYLTGQSNVHLPILVLGSIPVLNTQVLTLEIEVNKTCNFTTQFANMGFHEQT